MVCDTRRTILELHSFHLNQAYINVTVVSDTVIILSLRNMFNYRLHLLRGSQWYCEYNSMQMNHKWAYMLQGSRRIKRSDVQNYF